MKSLLNIFIVVVILVLGSQGGKAQDAREALLQKSKRQWQKLKTVSQGTYAYFLKTTAHGRSINTEVIVQAEKVVGALRTIQVPGKAAQVQGLVPEQIQRLVTLDKVYDNVAAKLKSSSAKGLKLVFDQQGLLQNAGFERTGCKGDCYEGYKIDRIKLKLGPREKVAVSLTKWLEFRTQWSNSYSFVRQVGGQARKFSAERLITVHEGKIIKVAETRTDFREGSSSRRLYTKPQMKRVKTLDQIYQYALKKLANHSSKTATYLFQVSRNGLLSLVGTQLKGCEDDCFRGYNISRITKGW